MKKILIVDHSIEIREKIISVLKDLNCTFHHCNDGLEAIELYSRLKPDWVVMDMDLKQISGLVAAYQIRSRDPKANIIIISNHDKFEFRQTAERYGVKHYLLKKDFFPLKDLILEKVAN